MTCDEFVYEYAEFLTGKRAVEAPGNGTTTCTGPATVSAVGTGPHQAPYTGHTGSLYPPIAGDAMSTVAVQNNFLGIGRAGLRNYGLVAQVPGSELTH
jgi:hypothetical protein